MGLIIPRRNLCILLIASALVLTEIRPTNGIRCMTCGDSTDYSDICDDDPSLVSIECPAMYKSCTRDLDGFDTLYIYCDTADEEHCPVQGGDKEIYPCVCLTDNCNSKPGCICSKESSAGGGGGGDDNGGGSGGAGKGGSGEMKKDKMEDMDSSQSALIPGAASTLMVAVATFIFMIHMSSF